MDVPKRAGGSGSGDRPFRGAPSNDVRREVGSRGLKVRLTGPARPPSLPGPLGAVDPARRFPERKDAFVNVSVEQLAPCKVLLKLEIDASAVDQEFEKTTADYQKQARLTGFRPGKAPAYLVARTYATQIEEEVRRRLFTEHYRNALKERNIKPVGTPDVEEIQFGRGKPFQVAVTLETEPDITLPEYKGIPVFVEAREVTNDDVERAVQVLREQKGEFIDVERPVSSGDFVVVNYTGTCEGKPITEHSPTARGLTEKKNFWMKVESQHFIPGFTDQLLGASAGERRTVKVTFPQDFVVEAVAGKEGVYEVEVLQVKERRLPELNDEFAAQFGAQNLEALRDGVRQDLQNELRHTQGNNVRNQIVKFLLDRVNCELPESFVQAETRSVVRDIISQNQRRGITVDSIQEHKDEIFAAASSSAKDRVKAAIILDRIAEKEKIVVERDEILARIELIARHRNERPDKLLKELQRDNQIGAIAEQILTAKVLDFLQSHAMVSEVPVAAQQPANP